jgi:hypothetical protein
MSTLHLDVNESGGWRRVMTFCKSDQPTVEAFASALLCMSSSDRLRARIIEASGTTAPLMTWTADGGWVDWPRKDA